MSKADIGATIGLDGEKEFKDQINKINMSLKTLSTELKATTAEYANNANSEEAMTAKNKVLNEQVELLTKKLDKQNEKLAQAKEKYEEGSPQIDYYQQEVNKTREALAKAENQIEDNNKALEDTTEENEKAAKSEEKHSDALGKLAGAFGAVLAAATGAVIAFAKESVEVGMAFDASMSQVAATMGTTVDSITELRDFAQEMGSTTAFSATQAADALNYMALAGYDADTAMGMLPNVLNLAAAGGIELAQASDMVTDAASALGLSLDETSELVDKMAQTSSKSNTSVAQLGEAILKIGGTAKMMTGGTTELATALGILADNGTKGAEGGTKLRNIILSLTAPTEKAADMLDEIGVNAFDAEGNMRPLKDTMADLNKALSEASDDERAYVISTIFNKADIKDVNALLNTSAERWDELSAAIDSSAGAAQAMADTQLDNLQGDITLFKSALEGAQIALSDQLTPSLREFVNFGSGAISQLTQAFQEGGLDGMFSALGDVLSQATAMLVEAAPTFVDAGMKLLEALATGLIENLPLIFDSALQIINSLLSSLEESLPELIPVAVEAILTLVNSLISNVDQLVDAAIAITFALADGLISALPILISEAPVIVQKLVNAIIENAPKLLSAALELIGKLASGIKDNLWNIVKSAGEIVLTLVDGILALRENLLDVGRNVVEGIIEGISNSFTWAWNKIKEWFGNVLDKVKSFLGINSPSKVFAKIGENMAAGIGVGWDDEFSDVSKDITSSMASLTPESSANVGVRESLSGMRVLNGVRGAMAESVNAMGSLMGGGQGNLTIQFNMNGKEFSRAILQDFRMISTQSPVIVNDF